MPERLDRFMARANALYYATRDPFADFTTAPEIAQMFGELLGAWAAIVWRQMGAPDPVMLVEAGPGRGTLMADARRATARVAPAFHAACRVHLIEFSARLRAEQAARVPDAIWHDDLGDVPPGLMVLVANEFLDALPVRQFVWRDAGVCERYVGGSGFVEFPLSEAESCAVEAKLGARGKRLAAGTVRETGEAGLAWIGRTASRLVRDGGAALVLDYGAAQGGPGDSLQAIKDGRPADPLCDPGTADLTAHVDFAALTGAARERGAVCWGPVPQGVFLDRLGLRERTAQLAAANPARAEVLRDSAGRLSAPDRMGTLFKVLCLTAPGQACPPGFAI